MKAERPNHLERITQDPNIMVGKPVVRGTRIPVERVIAHLADTPDLDDLFEAFPELKLEDVKACLAYAQQAVERKRGRLARSEQRVLITEDRDFGELIVSAVLDLLGAGEGAGGRLRDARSGDREDGPGEQPPPSDRLPAACSRDEPASRVPEPPSSLRWCAACRSVPA
jgi:uncharacterized protein (DUF433 family)